MSVKRFTIIAEVFGAIGTAEPLALDTIPIHTPVAKSCFMHDVLQVFLNDEEC
jgi:hypothetical protein